MFERVVGLAVVGYALWVILHRKRKKARPEYETPQLQGVGREKAHTELSGFLSEEDARQFVGQGLASPFASSLDGKWDFRLFPNPPAAIAAIESQAAIETTPINVPGHWQLQGHDCPIYTNVQYTFPVQPPKTPEHNPTGYYKRTFKMHPSWQHREVFLSFLGVDSAFYLWLNGRFVGFSKDSRLTAEFDITVFLHWEGDNTIEAVVLRYNDGSYLEDQDMWNLSGIYRSVHIYSLPKLARIRDFCWRTSMEHIMAVATVEVDVTVDWDVNELHNWQSSAEEGTRDWLLVAQLFEEGVMVSSSVTTAGTAIFHFDGYQPNAIDKANAWVPAPQLAAATTDSDQMTTTFTVKLKVNSPKQWSADVPYVYTLVLSLRDGFDGIVTQAESSRVGFRSVTIANGLLRVNGTPLIVRGVNRHEHHPIHGHTVDAQMMETDVKLMKRNNFNAVRCSHYPQHPWFYELCSLYGLFVVDEANIETHGMKPYAGFLADREEWEPAFLQRVKRMYARDKNHPCIIMWSLGNESGYGAHHDVMMAWLERADPSRFIMYEPASYGVRQAESLSMATHVLCPMYARVSDCVRLANKFPDFPLIQCEYSHTMGNSGGGLETYWKAYRYYPRLQGGFIWDWVDQGILKQDANGASFWAYGGDFGESFTDGPFCCNGLHWADRSDDNGKPALMEAKHCMRCFRCSVTGSSITCMLGNSVDDAERSALELEPEIVDVDDNDDDEDEDDADDENHEHHGMNGDHLDRQELRRPFGSTHSGDSSELQRSPMHRYRTDEGLSSTHSSDMNEATGPHELARSKSAPSSPERARKQRNRRASAMLGLEITEVERQETEQGQYTSQVVRRESVRDPASSKLTRQPTEPESLLAAMSAVDGAAAPELVPRPQRRRFVRYLTLQLSLLNDYDHVESLSAAYKFEALLLCNGLVLGRSPLQVIADGFRHDHNVYDELARPSVQELETSACFKVVCWQDVEGPEATASGQPWVCGRSWTWLANRFNSDDGAPTSQRFRTTLTDNSEWSVVVVGRVRRPMSWAPAGHIVGHSQLNIRKWVSGLYQGAYAVASADSCSVAPGRRCWSRDAERAANIYSPETFVPIDFYTDKQATRTSSSNVHGSSDSVSTLGSSQSFSRSLSIDANGQTPTIENESSSPTNGLWSRFGSGIQVSCNSTESDIVISADVRHKHLEVRVNRETGLLQSLSHGGFEYLANPSVLGEYNTPFRFHFHRAATDNDKGGYLFQWEVAGMDRALKIRPRAHVDGVMDEQRDNDLSSTFVSVEQVELPDGVGVRCKWRLVPHQEDRRLLALLVRMQKFLDNAKVVHDYFDDLSPKEEQFVYQLARAYHLGHEAVMTLGSQQQAATIAAGRSGGGGYNSVRVWKPAAFACSTTPQAESLARPRHISDLEIADDESFANEEAVDGGSMGPLQHIDITATYLITREGDVSITAEVDAGAVRVPLPRVGLQLFVNKELEFVRYFGKGPHENYPDRKSAAVNSIFELPCKNMFVPYVVPSENGNRCDTRWMKLLSSHLADPSASPTALRRLVVTSPSHFNFSVQPYTTEDLARATHTNELSARQFWVLNLDSELMGVGGDDSWTACVHEEFMLQPAVHRMQFVFRVA